MITVTFTSGHTSIKRGKRIRQYKPTLASLDRLSNLVFYGPTDRSYTSRSSTYAWCGLSTLTHNQRAVYDVLRSHQYQYNRSKETLDFIASARDTFPHLCHAEYNDNKADLHYLLASKECAIAVGIHPVLIEQLSPCPHGKAQSRCYSCYTTY